MQVQYVVDFDITRGTLSDLRRGMSEWFTYLGGEVSAEQLGGDGTIELSENLGGRARSASWETIGGANAVATRVSVRDINLDDHTEFITRVTVGQVNGRVRARVSMALDRPAGWLAPAAPLRLSQPGVIGNWAMDHAIDLTVQNEVQDGRYGWVRSDEEVTTLLGDVRRSSRLPIVIVHGRTAQAIESARRAAVKLTGLARVVTVDLRAARSLEAVTPSIAPPYAGARLVWSDPTAPTRWFSKRVVSGDDSDELRRQLMSRLATVSVIARGVDTTYRAAQQAVASTRSREARNRSDEAAASGNAEKIIEALRSELASAQEERTVWAAAAQEAEDEINELRGQAERVADLEAQLEQLKLSMAYADDSDGEDATDLWESLPDLTTGSEGSAEQLFVSLEEAANERIVFTGRAARSWKDANYPHPEEMREALIKLARVADALYDGTDREMGHLDTWVRENHDLRIALQDNTIKKRPKLRDFSFDGDVYDRTPHVKVRDAAPHSEVGRIHFCLDADNKRLIVDHVGVKLY